MNTRILNNYVPATLWLSYHLTVPTWQLSFLSALMLIKGLIVFFCFLNRDIPLKRAPKPQIVVAWISTFLPTLMIWKANAGFSGLVGELIAIAGMVMFAFTCLELGKSFGVSPALRTPVSGGIYSYISHPMYVSHIILETGILIVCPSKLNFVVAGITWTLYAVRGAWEKKLIGVYGGTSTSEV
jgi:protein-S-isoprenylcysteine O-methyltransferase Ste14